MHTLILGQTFTGKSALAKQLGTCLRANNAEVLAYNPTQESGYTRLDSFECQAAEYETHIPEVFAQEVTRRIRANPQKNRFLIIDESHDFFTRGNCAYDWIGTRGRHYGLHVIAITQRAAMLNPTFRGQCSNIYVFRMNMTDFKFIQENFWQIMPKNESFALQNGEYMKIDSRALTLSKGNIKDW